MEERFFSLVVFFRETFLRTFLHFIKLTVTYFLFDTILKQLMNEIKGFTIFKYTKNLVKRLDSTSLFIATISATISEQKVWAIVAKSRITLELWDVTNF